MVKELYLSPIGRNVGKAFVSLGLLPIKRKTKSSIL